MPELLDRLQAALADRYGIEKEIGRGGMAVVFLAEDLKHRRQVAIKVLHPELTATLGAERFLQEIEIVAGLQHPHILPLYDSGEANGLLYYIMPYAEGESLRHRLDREKQLAVDESIRITVEVADGLDYAHRKGVVHRDIKPGNILLAEGHATIADFGIAKAVEAARQERITRTGLGVGTPLYASPEQATAQETLDGRTDIYSLGCVLYEMLAGEPPVTGATPQMIQARRLSETPTALHTLRDTVPPALDQVIARALARVPADRYSTASEFGQALHAVIFSTPSAATGDFAVSTRAPSAAPTRSDSSKKMPHWVSLAAATLGIAAVIVGATLWRSSGWFGRGPLHVTGSNSTQVTRDPGLEFQPAISPDGSEVAYVVGLNGRVVVQSAINIGGGGKSRPGEAVGGIHWFPTWMPDGASIRFCNMVPQSGHCDWKVAGRLGGAVRTVNVPRQSDKYAWSPVGSRVAFAVGDSIFVHSEDGAEPELLAVQVEARGGPHSLVWSPDGRQIAYVSGNFGWLTSANVSNTSIWILDASGGEPVRVTDTEHMNVSPQWLPDSRHLMYVSNMSGPRGIYVVEVGPEGPRGPAQIIAGAVNAHSISISSDGRKLAYAKFSSVQNIRSVPIPRSGSASISDAVPVTTGNQIIELHDVSLSGEWIAFDSSIRGRFGIYKQPLAGRPSQPQLVAEVTGDAYAPVWSPDGSEIAFYSARPEGNGTKADVRVVTADGGAPEQLTDFPGNHFAPDWSPDGLAIAFQSVRSEGAMSRGIWIASRDGIGLPWGDPVRLTDFGCERPEWVPDGSGLLCLAGDTRAQTGDGAEIVLISREGEVLARYDPSTAGIHGLSFAKFSPDGTRIYFAGAHEEGSQGVWWIPATGGDPTKVVAFDDPALWAVFGFVSVGQDNLYFTIAEFESDIYVMDLEW